MCIILIFPSLFSSDRNEQVTFIEKPQLKLISFENYQHEYRIDPIKNIVVNQTLEIKGHFDIRYIDPLNCIRIGNRTFHSTNREYLESCVYCTVYSVQCTV